jgi:hypothetical protein
VKSEELMFPADGADRSADYADVYCADCGDGVECDDGGLCGVCAMLLKEQKEAAEAALNEAAELLCRNLDCPADWRHIEVPCPKIGKLSGHELCVACWRKWLREKAEGTVKGEQGRETHRLKPVLRPAEASDTGGDDATS